MLKSHLSIFVICSYNDATIDGDTNVFKFVLLLLFEFDKVLFSEFVEYFFEFFLMRRKSSLRFFLRSLSIN